MCFLFFVMPISKQVTDNPEEIDEDALVRRRYLDLSFLEGFVPAEFFKNLISDLLSDMRVQFAVIAYTYAFFFYFLMKSVNKFRVQEIIILLRAQCCE